MPSMSSILAAQVALCAEFPNDNPALHLGAIWVCPAVTGPAACERALVSERVVTGERPLAVEVSPTDELPPVLEAEDPCDDIEIVDEIAMDDAIEEAAPPPALSSALLPASTDELPREEEDPFVSLVAVMEDVARDAGASDASLASLRVVLGRSRVTDATSDDLLALRDQASAWQGILRGESEDFASCGASALDEWAAIAVAHAMGEPARTDGLRRDLRRRGVAAFGIVVAAA